MNKTTYIILVAALVVGSYLVGSRHSVSETASDQKIAKAPGRQVLYYIDPMNPAHTSDKPGPAPCGMPMEPVYADDHRAGGHQMPPGTARITAEQRQLMGVRVAPVEKREFVHHLRTLGTVTPDENLTYRITAGDKGWVWNVNASTTGSIVKKDQLMATVYNYDFLTRQQQYLYAMEFEERRNHNKKTVDEEAQRLAMQQQNGAATSTLPTASHGQGHDGSGSQPQANQFIAQLTSYSKIPSTVGGYNPSGRVVFSIRDQLEISRLELFSIGVSQYQIDQIAKSRSIADDLEIRAPTEGIVLRRNVSPQQRFDKGEELFVIADLHKVWVHADLFEKEARYIHPGMRATVSRPEDGEVFEAIVTDVPPVFDQLTQTLKLRLDVENPDFRLRPDMFVDVEILLDFEPTVSVPVDAVIDSGLRRTVFVERGEGYFEPRQVQTGWRFGDRVEITAGLTPDERIAVSGNFFIDSESRMQQAAGGSRPPDIRSDHQDHSPMDDSADRRDGDRTLPGMITPHDQGRPMSMEAEPATLTGSTNAIDPICGMPVDPLDAREAGRVSHDNGKTHFFCSDACKSKYDRARSQQMKSPTRAPGPESMDHGHRQYLQQQDSSQMNMHHHPVGPPAHIAPADHPYQRGGADHD